MSREDRKKKLSESNSESNCVELNLSNINSTTQTNENQESDADFKDVDNKKGRHFTFVVYPESAPEDWIEQLEYTGLAFAVSPLHDKDLNADNTPKKAHYHIIVSWDNTTTYRTARGLCKILNCPRPQILHSCRGMDRYFNHIDNPEKYQYKEPPKYYNGWMKVLDNTDIRRLKFELWKLVYVTDCKEYGQLLSEAYKKGIDYFEVVSSNTLFFKSVCDGYRHNPVMVLQRLYQNLEDSEEKNIIKSRLDKLFNVDVETGEVMNEENEVTNEEKNNSESEN